MIEKPTLEALMARIEKLEKRNIGLDDLPLANLQRRLEQRWQPNAGVLLSPKSVTDELMDNTPLRVVTNKRTIPRLVNFFPSDATWPGGATVVEVTIAHGHGKQPSVILATAQSSAGVGTVAAMVGSFGATDVTLRISTIGGFQPPAGTVTPVGVLTIG